MPPILNPHRNCEFEKKKTALSAGGPNLLLSKISELLQEPVKVVVLSTLCADQPHPDLGTHRLVALVGDATVEEVRSMVLELLAMVEAQMIQKPQVVGV